MGFFGRLIGGKKKTNGGEDGEGGVATASAPAMGMKRVEVPATPKMTKQEMYEELEKSYREVVDLVRRMKDHLDREEERSGQLMEIARRVDTALPGLESVGERVEHSADRSADVIVSAIEQGEERRNELAERMASTIESLSEHLQSTRTANERIASEMSGLGERVMELTQTSAASSASLKAIREGASDRDSRFVTSIESARKSIVHAIWIGASVVGVALIVAAIIFSQTTGSAPG